MEGAGESCAGATPRRLRSLRGPCTGRSAGTRGAAASARGSWGIRPPGSAQRIVRAARRGAAGRVSSFRIRHDRFPSVYPCLRPVCLKVLSAAQRSSAGSTGNRTPPSFRFLPQTGQMPLQSSRHTRCIGSASSTCSRRTSSSSSPSPVVVGDLGFARVPARSPRTGFPFPPAGKTGRSRHRSGTRRLQATVALGLHPDLQAPLQPDLLGGAEQLRRSASPQAASPAEAGCQKTLSLPAGRRFQTAAPATPSLGR